MKLFKDPRVAMAVSMAVFGTIGFFVRNISVSSGELALYRAMLAAALIGLYLLATKQKIPFSEIKNEVKLLLLSGAVMGVNWILFFQAFKYTTVSLATLSYYFAPVIVTVASTVLFREKLTGRQILCFIMSTLGLILITGTVGLSGGRDLIGVLFGIGAAFLYATVILLNKFIKNVDGIHRTLLQLLAVIVVLTPYVALTGGSTLGSMDGKGWISLLVIGLVHTGVFYCVYFSAMKELPGQKTAILSYIDPLVAVIVSVVILGEPLTIMQAIGGLLILGFTLLNEIAPAKK